ncbi:MAG: CotH kinase family protein [Eubacteriales bacterium]|nr:CotH kinase family protein [Eubacteriales bacterium]
MVGAAVILLLILLWGILPRVPKDLTEYTEKNGDAPIEFSEEEGFYLEGLSLELEAAGILPADAQIHYTLDGTEPGPESPVYEGSILLDAQTGAANISTEEAYLAAADRNEGGRNAGGTAGAGNEGGGNADGTAGAGNEGAENPENTENPASGGQIDSEEFSSDSSLFHPGGAEYAGDNPASGITVYTVRARICDEDGMTAVQSGVYCVGEGLLPCANTYIVCIDADPDDLFDYDRGILVGGRDLAETLDKHNGNYMKRGDDWVRPSYVAIFDGDGELLASQKAGISVSGGMSRRLEQKSLNLAAAGDYGEEDGHFLLDLFDDAAEGDCAHVGRYTHLRLRARSQVPRTFRETLVGQLGTESGFRTVVSPRQAIVFLNGSFYTLAELEPTISNSFLAHRYDLPDTDQIEKNKGKEVSVFRKMGVTDLFAADLTQAENRKALEAAVDMDDYILHYAINILDNNLDWPRNNVEAWRYTGEYDPARPYTDGRLRFVVFDSDKVFNPDPTISESFGTDSFESIMENKKRGYQSAFSNVMKSDVYRDRFVTMLCDLMNTSFDTEHVLSLLQEDYAEAELHCGVFFTQEYMEQIREDETMAEEAAASYNEMIRTDIGKYFGLYERYSTEIQTSEGLSVVWNNMYLSPDGAYSCDYYTGIPVRFTAVESPGWKFDHWEVNGKAVDPEDPDQQSAGSGRTDVPRATLTMGGVIENGTEGKALTIDGSRLADGCCTVRAIAVPVPGEQLVISEVSAAGNTDWIRLTNVGTSTVKLGRYCISDDPKDLQKYRLPTTDLFPGESCLINGSRNTVTAKALCTCSFSLTAGETVCLTPDEETGLSGDTLRIPRMSSNCSYGRRDNGGIFCWYDRRTEVLTADR